MENAEANVKPFKFYGFHLPGVSGICHNSPNDKLHLSILLLLILMNI